MKNPCITKHAPHLSSRVDYFESKGLSEKEALKKVVIEEHSKLHNDLINLKGDVGIKLSDNQKKFKSVDTTNKVKSISDIYSKKIELLKQEELAKQELAKQELAKQELAKQELAKKSQTEVKLGDNAIIDKLNQDGKDNKAKTEAKGQGDVLKQNDNGGEKPPISDSPNNSGDVGIVGITRKIMKQDEIDRNLTDSERSELYQHSSNEKAWEDVNKKVQANPNIYQERVNDTFEDVFKGDKPKVAQDDALIGLHERVRLRVDHNEISKQIKDAETKGDELSLIPLVLQREYIENRQRENVQFIKLVTSTSGKLLQSARFLSGEDFSFAGLTDAIAKEQGFPLTKEQQDKYRKLSEQHEILVKQMSDLQNKIREEADSRKLNEEADRKKFEDDTIKRLRDEIAKEKGTKPAVRTKADIKADLDKARAKFRIEINQMSSGGLQAISSFAEIVKYAVEYGVKSAAAFVKEFRDDFKGYSDKEIMDAFNKINGIDEFELLTKKAVDLADGELHEGMKGTIDKMLKAVVEGNPEITHVEATDKIYEALKEQLPDIRRDEVRDLISGYGKYKLLSKETVATAIREIRTQNRLDAAFEAVDSKNELPLRTGRERHEKTDVARHKEAQILKIIKDKGLTPDLSEEDIASQYKSAEATYQKRLLNAIADIEKEIETGERKQKSSPKEYNSERSKELKADLERLKEIRDAKFSEPKKTEGERIIEALRKKIDEINQRVVSDKASTGKDISVKDLNTIKDLQDELYRAKQESGLIKGKEFKTDEEKRVESENKKLENLKSKLDDLLAGKVRDKKISEPDSEEVKALKEQIKSIEHPPKTEAEKKAGKENAKVKATEKAISDIQDEIDSLKNQYIPDGEPTVKTKDGKQIFDFKKKPNDKITNDRIKELEVLKRNLQEAKSNLIPDNIKKQAIIAKERINRQRRLEALQTQVREKKYAPKPKPKPKPYDAKVEETNLKIKKLESIVANDKEQIRLANMGKVAKGIDLLSKIQRFNIFLNPAGMIRLSYAAMFRPAMRIPNEMAKYTLSKLPFTRRVMEKSPGMYRPTIGSSIRATKNYYVALLAKKTIKDAASEFNKRSNFSLLHDDKATDRYQGKVDFALSIPEMMHGYMKAYPKISASESTYKVALENLSHTIDPHTGQIYDITHPLVRQIAIEEAMRESYADVFMSSSELSSATNKLLTGMSSSDDIVKQIVGLYGKQMLPVVRVPANFYHEVGQQLPFIGMLDAAQIVARSGEVDARKANDGSFGGVENLTPDQAHRAARAMVNSAVGLMMVSFGIALYKKYDDEVIKKIEEYKYWLHNTGLPLVMMGLGIGKSLKEGKGVASSVGNNELHTFIDESVKLPQIKAAGQIGKLSWAAIRASKEQSETGKGNWDAVSKQGKEMLATLLIPAGAADIARRMDDNKKRYPKTFAEILKLRIPGLRETVGGDMWTDGDKKFPALKYFVDRKIELPFKQLDDVPIDDIPTKTMKKASDYSPSLQKLYISKVKLEMKKLLQKVINHGYVYKEEGYEGAISNEYPDSDVKHNKVMISKLSDKELGEILSNAHRSATDYAKEEVFTKNAQIRDNKKK